MRLLDKLYDAETLAELERVAREHTGAWTPEDRNTYQRRKGELSRGDWNGWDNVSQHGDDQKGRGF